MMKLNIVILFLSCAISTLYVAAEENIDDVLIKVNITDERLVDRLGEIVDSENFGEEEPIIHPVILTATKQDITESTEIVYNVTFNAEGKYTGNKYLCQTTWVEEAYLTNDLFEPLGTRYECSRLTKRGSSSEEIDINDKTPATIKKIVAGKNLSDKDPKIDPVIGKVQILLQDDAGSVYYVQFYAKGKISGNNYVCETRFYERTWEFLKPEVFAYYCFLTCKKCLDLRM